MTKPIWQPKHPLDNQMGQFMQMVAQKRNLSIRNYQELHAWSVQHPEQFWSSICDFFQIQFDTPANEVVNKYQSIMDAQWFSGATLNFAQQLLSRRDNHPAIICLNENNERTVITYAELYEQVSQCATRMKNLGIEPLDHIAGVLPNSQYAIIGMLAAATLGATWSSCSSEFGIDAIIDRLGQIEPKVLFICDGHQYNGKQFLAQEKMQQLVTTLKSLKQLVICPTIKTKIDTDAIEKSIMWDDFLQPTQSCPFVSLPFAHPLYILFSSGTTGKPKCIVHSAGGTLLQHIKELGLHSNLKRDDTLCFYTTCGWMMWNWSTSVLALGATLVCYEGSPTYPNTNRMFSLLAQEKVHVFGTSAKFISSIDKAQVNAKEHFDLSSLRCILSTGSPLLPKNYDYVYSTIKEDVQLSSISGGTDIVSCFALGNPMLPVYKGELQCLGLGMAVEVFNDQGQSITKERGELVCTKPFPSMPICFWNDATREKYKKAYFSRFSNVWTQGDFAEITEHNGLIIYGRSDAVLNPHGIRIGTAEIYRLVEQINEITDSVVIGQDWDDDVRIVLFVQMRPEVKLDDNLKDKIRTTIRKNASPRHVPEVILQVADIPKTMSGKTVELAVKQVVQGQEVQNIQSLANPQALEFFKNRQELM